MMKKMIFMAIVLAGLFFNAVKAQDDYNKGFYLKAGGAYFLKVTPVEFPAISGEPARDRVFNIIPGNPPTQQTVSERAITGSFGEGWRVGLTPGYRFSRILAVELGLNYFSSRAQDMMRQRGNLGGNEVLNLHNSGQVKALDVAPALVAYIPTEGQVKPYVKAGVIVPVGGYLEITTTATDQTGSLAESMHLVPDNVPPGSTMMLAGVKRVDRIKANPSIGFQSAIGFDWMLNDRISIYAELEYRNISVGGKKKELHALSGEYTVVYNGQPVANGMLSKDAASESSRLVNYHEELTSGDNVAGWEGYDANKPADDLRSYINIGGLGINLGVKIPFRN